MENYYELLEVSQKASQEVISKVFKYHIKKNHPDLFTGQEKIQAEQKVQKLNEAYEVLSNPEKRKNYDETLQELKEVQDLPLQEKINELEMENMTLKHHIQNYERFIHEYFYEKENQVYEIINRYDMNHPSYSPNNNKQSLTWKDLLFHKLKIFGIYVTLFILLLLILSIALKMNLFEIIFKVFFSSKSS